MQAEAKISRIVLGPDGSEGCSRRLLGGVPYKLTHHARVPVVIVADTPRGRAGDS